MPSASLKPKRPDNHRQYPSAESDSPDSLFLHPAGKTPKMSAVVNLFVIHSMPLINNFADLKKVSKQLKAEAKQREAELKAQKEQEERARRDANQFAAAMAEFGVRRMPQKNLADTHAVKPRPVVRHHHTEALPRKDTLSDLEDNGGFIESEEGGRFRRRHVSPDIPRKLYRGEWKPEATLDLHGLTADEARQTYVQFLFECRQRGYRCLRLIHGKGYNSQNGEGILRTLVPRWLKQTPEVMAFVEPKPIHGDSGALLVLLSAK